MQINTKQAVIKTDKLGIGGINCECCRPYKSKKKSRIMLNRYTRRCNKTKDKLYSKEDFYE